MFILSVLCALLSFFALRVFYNYSYQKFKEGEYISILAVKKGEMIEAYSPIMASDLEKIRVEKTTAMNGTFDETDLGKVVGAISWVPMGDGEPILKWKLFDEKKLLPKENETRYEIPVQDLTLVTEIRRGDIVKLWIQYNEGGQEQNVEKTIKPVFFQKTNRAVDFLFEAQVAGVKGSKGQEIYSLPATGHAAASLDENMTNDVQGRLQQTYRGQPSDLPDRLVFNWTDEQYRIFAEAQKFGKIQIGFANKHK